jgi:DNA-binding LytR/AlgR family response regulator
MIARQEPIAENKSRLSMAKQEYIFRILAELYNATCLIPDSSRKNFTYMDFDYSKQKDKKIQVNERNRATLIAVESITFLECDGYLTTIRTIDTACITVSKLLKHFEAELNSFGGFIRINRKTLVNIRHITSIRREATRKIIEINGCSLEVSHRKSAQFKIS